MYSIHSRTADKFVIRLPDGMRDRIAQIAHQSNRSMNSEIIHRLEQSLLASDQLEANRMQIDLDRAYKIIERLLQNIIPDAQELQDIMALVQGAGIAQTRSSTARVHAQAEV